MKIPPKNRLFLASTSASRKALLTSAGIPFSLLPLDVDEKKCDWTLPLVQVVRSIALYKMEHVIVPAAAVGDHAFVLTADTLSQDSQGTVSGKPASLDEARAMIRAARHGMLTCTAFCLYKNVYTENGWCVQERIVEHVQAQYEFTVPEEWLEWYLATSRGPSCAGAIAIEEHGGLFLRVVQGSYTTIVGLPLYEVRMALEALNFFE